MDFADRKIETPDLAVNYIREGSGAPLVLLHGWPEFGRSYKKNIGPLAAHFDVIVPDLRGFGGTRRRDGKDIEKTTAGILGADLTAFLDALKIDRVSIVSHDVGAYVAQNFARNTPQRTASLFFFNCPYPGIGTRWGEGPYLPEAFYQYFQQWPLAEELVGYNRDTCRIYFRHFLRRWSYDPHTFDNDLEMWVDNFMEARQPQGWFRVVPRRPGHASEVDERGGSENGPHHLSHPRVLGRQRSRLPRGMGRQAGRLFLESQIHQGAPSRPLRALRASGTLESGNAGLFHPPRGGGGLEGVTARA